MNNKLRALFAVLDLRNGVHRHTQARCILALDAQRTFHAIIDDKPLDVGVAQEPGVGFREDLQDLASILSGLLLLGGCLLGGWEFGRLYVSLFELVNLDRKSVV